MARAKSKKVKTANGMGSIVLRSDGRWMARFTTTDPATGLPMRRHLYARTEQAARVALIDALADRNAGTLRVRRGRLPTVSEYIDRWLLEKDPHLRPAVSKRYRDLLGKVTRRYGHQRLDTVEGRHVNTLLADLHRAGLSARTCNHVRAVLRAVLNDARRERLVAFNAAEDARPLKLVDSAELSVLKPSDVQILMREGATHRDFNLWVMGLGTAMRQGELLGLCWQAIDFNARLVNVVAHAVARRRKVVCQLAQVQAVKAPASAATGRHRGVAAPARDADGRPQSGRTEVVRGRARRARLPQSRRLADDRIERDEALRVLA